MKAITLAVVIALTCPSLAFAGGDAYDPPEADDTDTQIAADPIGGSGYQLYELASQALRPETTIDDDGVHATAYRDDQGRKIIDERFYKDSIISKKYFHSDGSAKETIFYIYDSAANLIKTVHRYQDGSESIFDKNATF